MLFSICTGFGKGFKLIGNGWCRTRCDVSDKICPINGYGKDPSSYDECKSACDNEIDCTGFAISNDIYRVPNRCGVYGNLTSVNVAKWTNPGAWFAKPQSTYGFIGFEVFSSNGQSGVRCFKKLEEISQNEGKSFNGFYIRGVILEDSLYAYTNM